MEKRREDEEATVGRKEEGELTGGEKEEEEDRRGVGKGGVDGGVKEKRRHGVLEATREKRSLGGVIPVGREAGEGGEEEEEASGRAATAAEGPRSPRATVWGFRGGSEELVHRIVELGPSGGGLEARESVVVVGEGIAAVGEAKPRGLAAEEGRPDGFSGRGGEIAGEGSGERVIGSGGGEEEVPAVPAGGGEAEIVAGNGGGAAEEAETLARVGGLRRKQGGCGNPRVSGFLEEKKPEPETLPNQTGGETRTGEQTETQSRTGNQLERTGDADQTGTAKPEDGVAILRGSAEHLGREAEAEGSRKRARGDSDEEVEEAARAAKKVVVVASSAVNRGTWPENVPKAEPSPSGSSSSIGGAARGDAGAPGGWNSWDKKPAAEGVSVGSWGNAAASRDQESEAAGPAGPDSVSEERGGGSSEGNRSSPEDFVEVPRMGVEVYNYGIYQSIRPR